MRSSRALALVALLAASLVAGGARADDPREESRAAFLRGVAEAHQNHFTAARDAFLEAYKLFPHPSILLNLGVARMHTAEYVAAEADLTQFLAHDGGSPFEDLADARATLVVVRRHLGTLKVKVAPAGAKVTLDGAPVTVGEGMTDVRAALGPAELRVEADGYVAETRHVVVDHDAPVVVDISLAPVSGGPVVAGAGAKTAEGGGAQRHTLLGWSLVGGGGVLAGVGVVAGIEAIVLANGYNTPGNASFQVASTKSEGIAWRTSSDILFLAAIGAGVAGAYLLLVPIHKDVAVSAAVSPSFAGLVGRF